MYASEALEYSETQEVPCPTQVAGIYTSVSAYASNSLRLFASYFVHYNWIQKSETHVNMKVFMKFF